MADPYYNPFQGIDLSVPESFRAEFHSFARTAGARDIDQKPFPRMVDLWFFALCVAAKLKMKPAEVDRANTYKIIEGSIFSSDPWRVHALMLIALAYTSDESILADPRKVMALANGLAISGLPKALEMLRDGESDPIWNVSEAVEQLLKKH